MLHTGGDEIESRGFNAAVAKNVRKVRYIPADLVKCPGEQVPEIMGKYFP